MIAEQPSASVRCNSMISNVGRRQSTAVPNMATTINTREAAISHSQSWPFATATPATFATVEALSPDVSQLSQGCGSGCHRRAGRTQRAGTNERARREGDESWWRF